MLSTMLRTLIMQRSFRPHCLNANFFLDVLASSHEAREYSMEYVLQIDTMIRLRTEVQSGVSRCEKKAKRRNFTSFGLKVLQLQPD